MGRGKAICLLSGGLDSTTVLWLAKLDHDDVLAVSFDYGQRHRIELIHAALIAQEAGVRHAIIDLTTLTPYLAGSALTDPRIEVPEGHYAEATMAETIVANRNAMMLNIGAAIAIGQGARDVFAAMHAGDHYIYPDCRPEFIESLNATLALGTETATRIVTPVLHLTKAEIVGLGAGLEVPFALTYSCYFGGAQHCGRCGTCTERIEAFRTARVGDPTVYSDMTAYERMRREGLVEPDQRGTDPCHDDDHAYDEAYETDAGTFRITRHPQLFEDRQTAEAALAALRTEHDEWRHQR